MERTLQVSHCGTNLELPAESASDQLKGGRSPRTSESPLE